MTNYKGTVNMMVGEKFPIGIEYRGNDIVGGVIVSAVAVAVSPATGLTITTPGTISGGGVIVSSVVTAVTAGEYEVTFSVTFSDGKIYKDVLLVVIKA